MEEDPGIPIGILRKPTVQIVISRQPSVTFAEGPRRMQPEEETRNSEDEEDYSASVNAIIKRRASTRRSRKHTRRASSPFAPEPAGPERRRSSVFTTSSGDTAITVDDNAFNEVTQEEIFENIRLHKEVLGQVKMQPWTIRKKLKLVVQAKSYIKKHEGQLQERLAQSHSTRDMLARWNIMLIKKWQKWKRELTNFSMWFIPWELKIKEIESHFGSVVASYFIFLRWLFWVNIVIAVVIISFVTIPEIIIADPEAAKERKFVLPEEKYNSTNLLTLWDFEGLFKYSPLFYGWYTNKDFNDSNVLLKPTPAPGGRSHHTPGYRLPFAYFVTGLLVYAYSFFATLRKMAENSRMSKLSEKDDECIFSWKLFTAWDYMIGNAETAHNRVASIVMGFKEALLEEAEKKRESRKWKVIGIRVLVNTLVICLFCCSAWAVVLVVKRSTEPGATSTVWRRNETTVVITLVTSVFPMMFEVLGMVEQYHPRKQLRVQLARIMVLNLLNLYSLVISQFDKIRDMEVVLNAIRGNLSESTALMPSGVYSTETTLVDFQCVCEEVLLGDQEVVFMDLVADVANNLTEMVVPRLSTIMSSTEEAWNVTTDFLVENATKVFENTSEPLSAEEVKQFFVDYLTYILSPFSMENSTTTTDSSSSTAAPNLTSVTYDQFKSTFLPILNFTATPQEELRFETELTTLFEDITTAVSTISSTEEFTSTTDSFCQSYCKEALLTTPSSSTALASYNYNELDYGKMLNYTMNSKLRSLCWETMFGQELIKLTIMDLGVTAGSILFIDFFRGIFVRYMNNCWCWDLEKRFPSYGDFKVAENILHLVNNQGMVWMGMFFSPGLVVINVAKLFILMYLRAWAVLTCNVPHEIIFRASRSNNFYYGLLLMMLFLCVLPVGYAIVWIKPSWHCGPFSKYKKIFHIFTTTLKATFPESINRIMDYIASPGIVIPLLLLLVLIIYYLVSLTGALREANNDLKTQLRRERTEERRKMFQLADRRRRGASGESTDQTPFSKWKKLLGNLPNNRSCEDTRQESDDLAANQLNENQEVERSENKGRDFFSKLIKKALGKASTSEDEQDGTDTDQHDSLPYDHNKEQLLEDSRDLKELQGILSAWRVPKKRRAPEAAETDKKPPIDEKIKKVIARDDSASSIWSDKIPVITISKTRSDEDVSEAPFRPRIKCALIKQSAAIDEDVIIHFSNDLQREKRHGQRIQELIDNPPGSPALSRDQKNLKGQKMQEMKGNPPGSPGPSRVQKNDRSEEGGSEGSGSDDTDFKDGSSIDTILNSPFCGSEDERKFEFDARGVGGRAAGSLDEDY
ncbi:transmembrane channel-like protein isoform X2 [Anthonomus grandis grandis]|uniref:transmembrane channel-like protein isoform X2 n=1 Tax=Anthonomus grandis grandis TaxID=2921223 RepID=UPI00216619EA|nr:transmembrane channel-like protein isoform X2 [Anthonomus grandis grandis]